MLSSTLNCNGGNTLFILLRLKATNRDESKCEKFLHSHYNNAPTIPYTQYVQMTSSFHLWIKICRAASIYILPV